VNVDDTTTRVEVALIFEVTFEVGFPDNFTEDDVMKAMEESLGLSVDDFKVELKDEQSGRRLTGHAHSQAQVGPSTDDFKVEFKVEQSGRRLTEAEVGSWSVTAEADSETVTAVRQNAEKTPKDGCCLTKPTLSAVVIFEVYATDDAPVQQPSWDLYKAALGVWGSNYLSIQVGALENYQNETTTEAPHTEPRQESDTDEGSGHIVVIVLVICWLLGSFCWCNWFIKAEQLFDDETDEREEAIEPEGDEEDGRLDQEGEADSNQPESDGEDGAGNDRE